MKRDRLFKKVLSLALALCLVISLSVPAVAAEAVPETEGVKTLRFEQVDNSVIDGSAILEDAVEEEEEEAEYAQDEVVRVSIVLAAPSVVEAGYSTEDVMQNPAALKHMKNVKSNQKNMQKKIEKATGKALKVERNLALVANIISADVVYGDIESIESVDGVKSVVVETQYSPSTAAESDAPQMAIASTAMTGTAQAWQEGYTGAGARIAIIDTGLDINHQSFNNAAFEYAITKDINVNEGNNGNGKGKGNAKGKNKNKPQTKTALELADEKLDLLDEAEIAAALPYLNAYAVTGGALTAADTVISNKIPFGFNYVDKNTNVEHIYDTQGEHGSHVAGIAAANRYLQAEDGTFTDAVAAVGVAGNAPDAQVLVMKVFGQGGGAYDSDYMAAIEDAIVLGCDSVNLSLGSGNAGMATSATYQELLDKLSATDTVVVMSAGNSGAWAENTFNGMLYKDGVNFDTAGSPGSFTNSLSVASVDNVGAVGPTFEVAGVQYGYTETSGYGNAPLATLAGDAMEYVFVDGFGEASDFDGIDVDGKVVFCRRGSISFFEKANNAVAAGAAATIIYNNQPGTISMNLEGYTYSAPCVSITQEAGAAIKAVGTDMDGYYTGTITFSAEPSAIFDDVDHYTMSSFSSWGIPGDLSMKPEITAPGGNIWSVNGSNNAGGGVDQYELMSGTSMAAPQIAGMTAVLKRYIEEQGLKAGRLTTRGLAQSLLMSTATPMVDAEGYYYSVMQQGAGLGNVYDAMNADSFITMGADATASAADGKVKVELGDDPERTGVYSFSFTLTNLTHQKVTYNMDADVFTQWVYDYGTGTDFLDGSTAVLDANVTFSSKTVTLKKNASTIVNVTIALTEEQKAILNENQPTGAYVEAYVYAEPTNGSSVHSIPVLGYYGSWTDPSMYDIGSRNEYRYGLEDRAPYLYANNGTNGNYMTVRFADGSGEFYFGSNLYATDDYHPEYLSMNSKNGDAISRINYALIRNAGYVAGVVTDAETGEVYNLSGGSSAYGAYYYTNGSAWRNTQSRMNLNWRGTGADGEPLAEGTVVNVGVVAAPEYYAACNYDLNALGEGAFFTTQLTIDNTAPVVELMTEEESGSLAITAKDNVAIAAILLYGQNGQTLVERAAVSAPEVEDVLLATDLEDDIYLVSVIDYAGNTSTYRVLMNVDVTLEVESVTLNSDELVLMKNNSAQLTAAVAPSNIIDASVTWTTSDASVAVVDANGIVTGVGTGECVITAASVVDPTFTAECAVTVIEISKDLNGLVWDEEGAVWFSQFNTADLPNYTKLSDAVSAPVNGLAYGYDGTLYATDLDTEKGISNLYTVGADFSLDLVGASTIAYTEIAEAPHLGNVLLATYFNYIVIVDAETGDYMGIFDYSQGADLVGIAYKGSILSEYYNEYIDIYYLLDADGNLYEEVFMPYDGGYACFNGAEKALLGNIGVSCDVSYFQSLYTDGQYVYVSSFSEAKNVVDLYAADPYVTGSVYYLGSFNDGVWPVAGLCKLNGSAVSINGAAYAEAVIAAEASTEAIAPRAMSAHK